MKRLAKYQAQKADLLAKIDAVLEAASANEDGRFTEAQQQELDGLKAKLANVKTMIAEQEALDAEERAAPAISRREPGGTPQVTGVRHRSEDDRLAHGFASHRDYLISVRRNSRAAAIGEVSDERLRPLAVDSEEGDVVFMLPMAFTPPSMRAAVGSDEQNASQDQYGGYSVRETMLSGMLQVDPEADPTAGRVQPVPMESPSVKILARTDKDHSSSVSGGLAVVRRSEMGTFQAARQSIERVQLTAAMLAGLSYETEELLQDSMLSFIAIIEAGFRSEFPHKKLSEKIRGTGGDQYLGILTALASATAGPTITVAKETGQAATTIVAQNILKMRARCWGYGNAIWLANHDCYPQLRAMSLPTGVGGQLVYSPSLVEGRPDMLDGRPIFYGEYPSTLGTIGDLILSNWSQYLEGIYQPIQSASSIHVRFETHERTFKFWERNCGAPWWRVPLTPNQGANTLSPFVVLATRS